MKNEDAFRILVCFYNRLFNILFRIPCKGESNTESHKENAYHQGPRIDLAVLDNVTAVGITEGCDLADKLKAILEICKYVEEVKTE